MIHKAESTLALREVRLGAYLPEVESQKALDRLCLRRARGTDSAARARCTGIARGAPVRATAPLPRHGDERHDPHDSDETMAHPHAPNPATRGAAGHDAEKSEAVGAVIDLAGYREAMGK
jgi:hypothetical protein